KKWKLSNGKKLYECTICGIVLQNPKSFNIQRHLKSRKCKKIFGSLTDTEKLELQKGKSEDLEVDRSISRLQRFISTLVVKNCYSFNLTERFLRPIFDFLKKNVASSNLSNILQKIPLNRNTCRTLNWSTILDN
ncbi:hypothetical protein SNEBB_002123, partial [Seison nebaliae]